MKYISKKKFYNLIPDGGHGVNAELLWFIGNTDIPEEIFSDCDSLEELNEQAKELYEEYNPVKE